MKKRLMLLLLAAAVSAALCACGTDGPEKNSETETNGTADVADITDTQTEAVSDDSTEPADTVSDTDTQTETPVASASEYTCFLDNGVSIVLGGAAADALAVLGEYDDIMEAPNCVYVGMDRVYTWNGLYTVTTMPSSDGTEIVTEISLLSDLVTWQEDGGDLYIGCTADEVYAVLGDPDSSEFGLERFSLSADASVSIMLDDGYASSITLIFTQE
ncbi:MAG: hypothetical protein IJC98_04930 [Clostridia bacterium]|nr:hypothetical protein [Clostridia bacterium]